MLSSNISGGAPICPDILLDPGEQADQQFDHPLGRTENLMSHCACPRESAMARNAGTGMSFCVPYGCDAVASVRLPWRIADRRDSNASPQSLTWPWADQGLLLCCRSLDSSGSIQGLPERCIIQCILLNCKPCELQERSIP